MKVTDRQKILLVVLVLVLAIVGYRSVRGWMTAAGASFQLGLKSSQRGASDELQSARVLDLYVAKLDREPGELEPGRDPFRFAPKPRPAPPPPAPQPVRRPPQVVETPRVNPQPVAPPEPQPPDVDVKYLGSFGPERLRIATFSDLGDESSVHIASQGEIVKGKFIVHEIGLVSVDLKFVGFPDAPPKRLGVGRQEGGL